MKADLRVNNFFVSATLLVCLWLSSTILNLVQSESVEALLPQSPWCQSTVSRRRRRQGARARYFIRSPGGSPRSLPKPRPVPPPRPRPPSGSLGSTRLARLWGPGHVAVA